MPTLAPIFETQEAIFKEREDKERLLIVATKYLLSDDYLNNTQNGDELNQIQQIWGGKNHTPQEIEEYLTKNFIDAWQHIINAVDQAQTFEDTTGINKDVLAEILATNITKTNKKFNNDEEIKSFIGKFIQTRQEQKLISVDDVMKELKNICNTRDTTLLNPTQNNPALGSGPINRIP